MDTPQEEAHDKGHGRARDRHRRRKQKQAMVVRGGTKRATFRQQIRPQDRIKLPSLRLPKNPIILGIPLAFLVVIGVIAGLALLKDSDPDSFNNAIWVDKSWTYGGYTEGDLADFSQQLQRNRIGTIYAYVSTLNINNNWSGGQQGQGSFMQSRDAVANFVADFKRVYPAVQIYGWIEIWTTLDNEDGYRLDDEELQANVADFSERMIDELGFDGVFLDVKPLFTDNEDFLRLMRAVRASVGLDTPIAVAVPADLTPNDENVAPIAGIAPGTMWNPNFKQRVMISANEIVITAYQSYRDNPLDYMNWVAYQVDTYVNLIANLELNTDTKILVSIPNYQTKSNAHDPAIETIAAALDGINLGLDKLDEEQQPLLTGVAIFSDRNLSDAQWDVYQQKWLNR